MLIILVSEQTDTRGRASFTWWAQTEGLNIAQRMRLTDLVETQLATVISKGVQVRGGRLLGSGSGSRREGGVM